MDRLLVALSASWTFLSAAIYTYSDHFLVKSHVFGALPSADRACWVWRTHVCPERMTRSNDFAYFGGKKGSDPDGRHPRRMVRR
jgi:hypothetical protein